MDNVTDQTRVTVPREPTEAMWAAGETAIDDNLDAAAVWSAMIAAAAAAPATPHTPAPAIGVEPDAEAARELVEWWDTGILRGGIVRREAERMLAAGKADGGNEVRQAEREIIGRIVRRAALSAPAPAQPSEVEWRDRADMPNEGIAVLVEYHPWNLPSNGLAYAVAWVMRGCWRTYPEVNGEQNVNRWTHNLAVLTQPNTPEKGNG